MVQEDDCTFEFHNIDGKTSLTVTEKDYMETRARLIEYAKQHGLKFNPKENCYSLIAKVTYFKCCPCVPGMKCPCKASLNMIEKKGVCKCGLYVKV